MSDEQEYTGTIEIRFTIRAVCRINGFGDTKEAARNDAIVTATQEAHAEFLTPRITNSFWQSPRINLAELDENTVKETEFRDGDLRYVDAG
jgi:hypothetical protein